jgi:hypothetical protein
MFLIEEAQDGGPCMSIKGNQHAKPLLQQHVCKGQECRINAARDESVLPPIASDLAHRSKEHSRDRAPRSDVNDSSSLRLL